jgi:hypothetical protein
MMNLQTIRTLWFVLRPVHECPAETVAQLDRAIGRALSVAKRFKLTSKCKAASAVVSELTEARRCYRRGHVRRGRYAIAMAQASLCAVCE